jgi:hypothetical protein
MVSFCRYSTLFFHSFSTKKKKLIILYTQIVSFNTSHIQFYVNGVASGDATVLSNNSFLNTFNVLLIGNTKVNLYVDFVRFYAFEIDSVTALLACKSEFVHNTKFL